ncbi:protein kinase domain-containing protein [Planctomicrobium piriforme]|uniref:Protein kinase domain-containing protein n=1 Tax=Planctomicrobium piriforme TaxID=1576369 RepID=A0A1I3T7Z2_9PLAN|nr:protein kinase [Planctomicrobium piriforme]SFJ65617.1 hypothetical protein SAMN05421753_12733 [Planctomicrobium piriforme]
MDQKHPPSSSSAPAAQTAKTDQTPVQSEDERAAAVRLSQHKVAIPSTVGGYEVLKSLGEGSFGSVWLAREMKTGRQVAIKFFTNRRGLDWSLLTREVEKLAVLDASRDVVRLLDVGVDHDPPYFVMEYLPHRSVAHQLDGSTLTIEQSIAITRAVSRALVHAHSAGILHCDIKPANVLLDHGDEARLGDFGQSRLTTDHGSALGTFYYMAPEQAAKNAVPDVRWDVYAVGALLYHMLTGNPPYRTEETDEQLNSAGSLDERLQRYRDIIESSPFPHEHHLVPRIDGALTGLIDRCLARDPTQRLQNPQVILDLLEKRDLNRARRPLIWLGILGPLLFLAALFWIGKDVIEESVKKGEEHLSERALASDLATARLLAASVQQELEERQAELERLARRLASQPGDTSFDARVYGLRSDVIEILDKWRSDTDQRLRKQQRTIDESFFLTDQNGIQLYRSPWKDSIGQAFSYRDYFHGQGRELSPNDLPKDVAPRTQPGISMPFRSSNTGQYMVAIATPVWNVEQTEVIGVLGRSLLISELLSQWENRINGKEKSLQEKDRLLSLVDLREEPPLVLDHHWIQSQNHAEKTDARMKETLHLTQSEETELRRALRAGGKMPAYEDPMSDQSPEYAGVWLAAGAKASFIDWVAIVQERRDAAVQPMQDLLWIFVRYGLLLLVVCAALLFLLWCLVRRIIAI